MVNHSSISKAAIFFGVSAFALGMTFQNCSKFKSNLGEQFAGSTASQIGSSQFSSCLFNGQAITAGSSVTAYQQSSVPSSQQCVSQTRTCSDGVLSGSFTNASCMVVAAGNCALGAQEIANGATVSGYSAAQVGSGQTCASVAATATCTNGVLSKNIYSACSIATSASCQFNGQFLPDGASITSYLTASVPFGSACSPEVRTCTNGTLSGNYAAPACVVAPSASCNYANTAIASGESVSVYSVG